MVHACFNVARIFPPLPTPRFFITGLNSLVLKFKLRVVQCEIWIPQLPTLWSTLEFQVSCERGRCGSRMDTSVCMYVTFSTAKDGRKSLGFCPVRGLLKERALDSP